MLFAQAGGNSTCSEQLFSGIPVALLADSYKAAHFAQYPDALRMVAVRLLATMSSRNKSPSQASPPV